MGRMQKVVALALVPILLMTSCGPMRRELHRELQPPEQASKVNDRAPYLIAHMRDGHAYVLDTWTIHEAERTVTGHGRRLDASRAVIGQDAYTVPIDSVALFETNVVSLPADAVVMRGLTIVVGILAVVGLAFLIACIADPKCFGSCPTFYVWDGGNMKLQAEGFSASVSPSLEATDVDALARARPAGRTLEVVMKNEAPETHVVRYAHVLAAPRPPGGLVYAATDGSFRQATRVIPPLRCTALEGDVTEALRGFDARERTSSADSTDLAARETIEVVFPAVPDGEVGIVLASRQSLLTSFLFYQGLAYLGRSAGTWLASIERGVPGALDRASGIGRVLGGIEIETRSDDGAWRPIAEVHETGPLATDVRVIPLPAGALSAEAPVVRLRMARGAWRVNQVALAALGPRIEPIRLRPERVLKDDRPDEEARRLLADTTRALVTLPGDTYTIRYRLPEHPERYELFLETRGYYLEWIREPWLATEDPARAAMMGLRPREALRALASEYKRIEAEFERNFWGHRHAGP
jgi:hypothetical protein